MDSKNWKSRFRELNQDYENLMNEHNLLKQNYESAIQGRKEDADQIKYLRREIKKLKKRVIIPKESNELSSEAIKDFAKTIFTRQPNISTLFSTLRGEDQPIQSPSMLSPVHRMSDKPKPANADEGLTNAYTDPGIYEAFFLVGISKQDL